MSAATIGLTYRGVDIQEPGFGIFLELVRGLSEPASVRGDDLIIPGRPGRLLGARQKHRRTIELRGIVTAHIPYGEVWYDLGWIDPALVEPPILEGTVEAGYAEHVLYRRKADEFRALFDPTIMGELRAFPEDGSERTINARTVPAVLWSHVNPVLSKVSVELESLDPDWEYAEL